MKKQLYVYVCFIIIILCAFPLISFGKNVTEIKINVYEIIVNCDKNGSFTVEGNNYTENNNFFVGKDGSFTINAIPNIGYEIESIDCEPNCKTYTNNENLTITNINDNIIVNIKFRPEEIPSAGLNNTIPTVNQDIEENTNNRN